MISVLFCSRVKDNPDSNIARLLDSAAAFISPAESRQIEFLIKYDDDDDGAPRTVSLPAIPFPFAPSCGLAAQAGTLFITPRSTCLPSAIRAPDSA